jgi:hypothetical protein
MNSRQLAQKWQFPRYKTFEKEVRESASNWLKKKGFYINPRRPYCLSSLSDWKNNIILHEVADYIDDYKKQCEGNRKPFPLHKYVHHGLSSQAMAFNLIGPLITRNDLNPLLSLLNHGENYSVQATSASFEHEDRKVFKEDAGQPTSIDVVLNNEDGQPVVFIESKFVEKEFGGCSVFAGGDCNGRNPLHNKSGCFLHFIGRKYWDLIEKYGFDVALKNEKQCIFVAHYQFFREVLFSIEKDGVFVLLSDERSPVFHCSVNGSDNGLMPFLMEFVPEQYKNRILSISIQKLVGEIKKSVKHQDWICEFEAKYGLQQKS